MSVAQPQWNFSFFDVKHRSARLSLRDEELARIKCANL
jgi:hypothetical protein